jgi:uncharacterized membrane protein
MTPHRPRNDSHLRSLLKAISWRCVGTLDTFTVSFFVLSVTGATESMVHTAKVSGGIAGVEVITKITLYYLHERAWARVRFGQPRQMTYEENVAENAP